MEYLKKISYIFDKKQKRGAALLVLALTLGAFLELLGVGLIVSYITLLMKPGIIHRNSLLSGIYDLLGLGSDNQFFALVTAGLIFVYIFKNSYLLWLNYLEYKFIYNNQLRISGRLIDCYLKKPYTYHLDNNSAMMVRNVMLDSERFFQMLLSFFLMLTEILVSVFLCIFVLLVDPFIAITTVLIMGAFTGCYLLAFKGKAKKYGRENQLYDGRMHQAVNQALGAVKDIKILHRERFFVDEFISCGEKKMLAVRKNNLLGQAPKYFIETVCVLSLLIVLLLKLASGSNINDLFLQLSAFAMAAVKLLPSVSKINNYMNLIIFLKPSADLIYRDIKDTEDMLTAAPDEGGDPDFGNGDIRVEKVSYRYPHTDRDVLTDAELTIPAGCAAGFVGPSGAGKSTLADLILGILTPTAGKVTCGGVNVHSHPAAWARKLAYIPQSIFLADSSIRSNVAFGIAPEEINEDKVWEVLEEAQLAGFVRGLPGGLDTEVGERGVRLSGGQRQRIGIARALYSDPEILVLDEATAALDNDTESAVMEAIEKMHGKKTLIIIAHRLSTIENCDMVYKIDRGRVFPEIRKQEKR